MNLTNRQLGALGEQHAASWLVDQGYEILAQNWRGARVELDLVARKQQIIIFVEVKTRSSKYYGSPAEAVTKNKLKNIKSAALQWLNANNATASGLRIDVISILSDGKKFQVTHIPGVY